MINKLISVLFLLFSSSPLFSSFLFMLYTLDKDRYRGANIEELIKGGCLLGTHVLVLRAGALVMIYMTVHKQVISEDM